MSTADGDDTQIYTTKHIEDEDKTLRTLNIESSVIMINLQK